MKKEKETLERQKNKKKELKKKGNKNISILPVTLRRRSLLRRILISLILC